MAKFTTFEELEVYSKSLDFAILIYDLTLSNELLKVDFGLKDQIRRASVSISNNIAEGFERGSKKEFIRFLYISKGSAGEVRNLLKILYKINYIEDKDYTLLNDKILEISKQLSNFIKYLNKLVLNESKIKV